MKMTVSVLVMKAIYVRDDEASLVDGEAEDFANEVAHVIEKNWRPEAEITVVPVVLSRIAKTV